LLLFLNATTAIYYYLQTFGVDLNVKTVSIPDTNDSVELFLYDSSGQEFYNEWLSKYVSNDNEN
jgi:transport family protein 27